MRVLTNWRNTRINYIRIEKYSLESSSQHAAHVQLVACGVIIPSSISAWRLRPPYRIDRFQSLLEPRPHKFSNSLGVNHWSLYFMHRPRPPEPNRDLNSSAVVVLHRIGNTSRFIVSFQLVGKMASWSVCCCCCCWCWFCVCVCCCCCCCCCACWFWCCSELRAAASCCCPLFVDMVSDVGACCCMTICVGFISPPTSLTTALPDRKPLLSTHSICLKCGSWSGVITLKAVPINEPTGSDTGTETTVPLSVVAATKRVVVRWTPCFTDINFDFLSCLNNTVLD